MEIEEAQEEFKCERCGYKTDNISNIRRHVRRKTVCKPKVRDISIDVLRTKYLPDDKDKNIECTECGKKYSSRQGLYLHLRNDKCVDTKDAKIERLENMMQELKKEIEDMKQKPIQVTNNTTINNNNTANINNIIVLNPYGSEDTSHLTHELLSHCILNPSKGLPALIDNIHYNPNIPENHNVRYKSTKNNSFEKYVNQHWMECDASNTLDELIRKGYRIMNAHYMEHILNNPEYSDVSEIQQRALEMFRFLSDKTSNAYHSVKREVRLLVKDRTMYLIESPTNNMDAGEGSSEYTDMIEE